MIEVSMIMYTTPKSTLVSKKIKVDCMQLSITPSMTGSHKIYLHYHKPDIQTFLFIHNKYIVYTYEANLTLLEKMTRGVKSIPASFIVWHVINSRVDFDTLC